MKEMSLQPPLLSMNLSVSYRQGPEVLRNLRLTLQAAEVLGLVGQSGAGKSTLALSILGLLDSKRARLRGSIELNGRELLALNEGEMRQIRGREVALVLQSPLASLNPALRIGTQLSEAWRAHARGSRQECEISVRRALREVQLPDDHEFWRRYPSQLSVGQAQRVLIAMAILHRPPLLIADEPTSALDVVTQAEILELFARLHRQLGMAVLYITHDLLSVARLCQRVAILYQGEIVECGPPKEVFSTPAHPYTQRLVQALPRAEFRELPKLAVARDGADFPAARCDQIRPRPSIVPDPFGGARKC
jgi:ABC-type glutathione transport system ATPase component